jgi:hypothetical protein
MLELRLLIPAAHSSNKQAPITEPQISYNYLYCQKKAREEKYTGEWLVGVKVQNESYAYEYSKKNVLNHNCHALPMAGGVT